MTSSEWIAADPIVVSRTWWPQITAAMCAGSPVRIASVMSSLRKPCGVDVSGWLLTSVGAAVVSARISDVRALRPGPAFATWRATSAAMGAVTACDRIRRPTREAH